MHSIHPASNLRNFPSIHEISVRDKSKNQIQNCIVGKDSCEEFEGVEEGAGLIAKLAFSQSNEWGG